MKYKKENGNAIMLIFIAVALFGALAFAFNQSSRTSASLLTQTQINNYSDRIISYTNEVKSAVKRLELRGCLETEISFENFTESGYENPVAPVTQKCHVFETEGGGLTWQNIDALITTESWLFTAHNQILGIGSDDPNTGDLIMVLPDIREEVCNALNEKYNNNFDFPPEDNGSWDETLFVGNYTDTEIIGNTPNFENISEGCFEDDEEKFVYYTVLIKQ